MRWTGKNKKHIIPVIFAAVMILLSLLLVSGVLKLMGKEGREEAATSWQNALSLALYTAVSDQLLYARDVISEEDSLSDSFRVLTTARIVLPETKNEKPRVESFYSDTLGAGAAFYVENASGLVPVGAEYTGKPGKIRICSALTGEDGTPLVSEALYEEGELSADMYLFLNEDGYHAGIRVFEGGGEEPTEEKDFVLPKSSERILTMPRRTNIRSIVYTISFDPGEGTGGGKSSGYFYGKTLQTLTEEGILTIPEAQREGYVFAEWNTKRDGSGLPLSGSMTVMGDLSFYAIWVEKTALQTVTFHDVSGPEDKEEKTLAYAEGMKFSNLTSRLPSPSWKDGTFQGWFVYVEGEPGEPVTPPETTAEQTGRWIPMMDETPVSELSRDIYAKWECTVKFNANGGKLTDEITSLTVPYGATLPAFPNNPTYGNYRFAGWYDKSGSTGGTQYTPTTVIRKNVTLYARWLKGKRISYSGVSKVGSYLGGVTPPTNYFPDSVIVLPIPVDKNGDRNFLYWELTSPTVQPAYIAFNGTTWTIAPNGAANTVDLNFKAIWDDD